MKIILLENVKGTGLKDEVKEVKDGFGNFLINNKKAVMFSSKSKEVLNTQIKERKEEFDELINKCNELKRKLESLTLVFKVNTGKDGKIFGNISSKQISEELKNKGFDIDKKIIKAEGLNTLGLHIVEVQLHKTVVAKLNINIKGGD